MPRHSKSKTIITVPVGKNVIHGLAFSLFFIVVGIWTLAWPDDEYELIVESLVCIVALITAAILLRSKTIEYESGRAGFELVAPGLWQGGLGDELFSFDNYDFDVVVDLRADSERPDKEVKTPIGKRYIRWPMDDRTLKSPEEIEMLAQLLARKVATRKVGVFCAMGINRSGLVCAETARLIAEQSAKGSLRTQSKMFNEDFVSFLRREVND